MWRQRWRTGELDWVDGLGWIDADWVVLGMGVSPSWGLVSATLLYGLELRDWLRCKVLILDMFTGMLLGLRPRGWHGAGFGALRWRRPGRKTAGPCQDDKAKEETTANGANSYSGIAFQLSAFCDELAGERFASDPSWRGNGLRPTRAGGGTVCVPPIAMLPRWMGHPSFGGRGAGLNAEARRAGRASLDRFLFNYTGLGETSMPTIFRWEAIDGVGVREIFERWGG